MSPVSFSIKEMFLAIAANIAASAVGPADMIGYAILATIILAWIVSWHRRRVAGNKRGMDSIYFIALAMLVAGLAIGGAAYGIGVRSLKNMPPSASEASRQEAAVIKEPSFIKDVLILGDRQNPLTATFVAVATTERLRFYVDASPEFMRGVGYEKPNFRAQIGELRDVVKGQQQTLQLAFEGQKPSPDQPPNLFWGDPKNAHHILGINRARFVVIGPDGSEQMIYFMLVILPDRDIRVIANQQLDWVSRWKSEQ